VQFRQAENYPVDLYYVMDMSNSMKDDKERLALLGDLLGQCYFSLVGVILGSGHSLIISANNLHMVQLMSLPPRHLFLH